MTKFPHISERQGEMYIEDCSLQQLGEQYGTPLYVYSHSALTAAFDAYKQALNGPDDLVCYAVKANSNLALLNLLARRGAGFDIVSQGELERVIRAGGDPAKVVFSGVGKTPSEMQRALEVGVRCFNVESAAELDLLAEIAENEGKVAPISFRVNPDVDAKTHPYISTGLKENKFGIEFDRALDLYKEAAAKPSLQVVGMDCHIGSQLTQLTPFLDALDRMLALVDQLDELGIHLQHLDLGGGLGVAYADETPPAPSVYIEKVREKLAQRNLGVIVEPGRSICAQAGVLLTKVLYLKPTEHKNFAIIDAAMNDNLRPSLYSAWQEFRCVKPSATAAQDWDLVGPVCETGDFLAKERSLALNSGDYLAMMSAGAYGFTMASNYNTRARAAEVMVDGSSAHLIRERETFEQLIQGEHLLPLEE